jgi:hypothetical protein
MSAKEYNINQENKLSVGDELKDKKNQYVVTRLIYYSYQHSQYAEDVELECLKGPHKGRTIILSHELAKGYKV